MNDIPNRREKAQEAQKTKTFLRLLRFFAVNPVFPPYSPFRSRSRMQGLRIVISVAALVLVAAAGAASSPLRVNFELLWDGKPLEFDAPAFTNRFGQKLSVTRLDFLVANMALRRADGSWRVHTNDFAFINGRSGRTGFTLGSVSAGSYDRVRFQIGLPPRENHADPAGLAPDDPLHPNVNGLHWNWKGGYVFLAVEGSWLATNDVRRGYSWHLATDRMLTTIELPVRFHLDGEAELRLDLNVAHLFSGKHAIQFNETTTSTHSRKDDILAGQLRENLEQAFAAEGMRRRAPVTASPPARFMPTKIEMAANATPYRLTFSAHFPRPRLPRDNPLTEEGVALGRRLFHDTSLSRNGRQSCATCHLPELGFAEARRVSVGAEGRAGSRNAMSLLNLAWKSSFFWDGRVGSLREQVLMPIENPLEMHESLTNVLAKLRRPGVSGEGAVEVGANDEAKVVDDYPSAFARAFGTPEITGDRLARALEQFLLVQVANDSKFDRSLVGTAELTEEEKRGFELFHTEYDPRRGLFGADCFHCHGGPLFQSQSFANIGLDAVFADVGRFQATGQPGDRGKFAVPSLRNVALTAPYMHDGRMATLEDVVAHYNGGVRRSDTLDPNLAKHPDTGLGLSTADQRALVAFLRTLTETRLRQ